MEWCLARPDRPCSWRPLVYACMPGMGKLGLSYGATLVGRDAFAEDPRWIAGGTIMALSGLTVLLGIYLLGDTVARIHAAGALRIKAASITGGVVMGVGYGLWGFSLAAPEQLWSFGAGTTAKWLGTAMMCYTLPTFVAHAVAVCGDMPFHRHRGTVASVLLAVGTATLVAHFGSGNHVPLAGSTAATVAGSFCCALAGGIYSCALPPWPFARQDVRHVAPAIALQAWPVPPAADADVAQVDGSICVQAVA